MLGGDEGRLVGDVFINDILHSGGKLFIVLMLKLLLYAFTNC